VGAGGGARQLQPAAAELHRAVVVDRARVLDGEQQLEIDPDHGDKGTPGGGRLDREACVEVRDEDRGEVAVGLRVGGHPRDAQLLGQAALNGAEGPLAAPPRLRRVGQDLPNAEHLQRPTHLPPVLGGPPACTVWQK
jgi:hypothetical protein